MYLTVVRACWLCLLSAVCCRWFERAAAQGDPEGLYNMGVFYTNGQVAEKPHGTGRGGGLDLT